MMNEALYKKVEQQINSKMLAVIKRCMSNCKGSEDDKLLSQPFGFLSDMEDLRDNLGGVIDFEEHPTLAKALENGVDLGEAFWITLTEGIYIYDFDQEYEYDKFLNNVKDCYVLGSTMIRRKQ